MDLLSQFDTKDLSILRQRAEELEKYIIDEINKHGVELDIYNTVEDFLAKN